MPALADILAKRARGETLSLAERGRLSWYGRKRAAPGPGPAGAAPPLGQPAAPGGASGGAPAAGLVPPELDPQLVKDTVAALVEATNGVRQNFVAGAVEKLGAPPAVVNRFAARAGMAPATKTVLVETSPAVARSLGLRSDYFPLAAFAAALAADLGGFAVLLRELRQLARELRPAPAPEPPQAQTPPAP